MVALKFFSKLFDAISSTPMATMTAKQARKLINKSEAPSREIEYTGILDAIPTDPKAKVTKQSLLDALSERPLSLKTTRRTLKGDKPLFSLWDEPLVQEIPDPNFDTKHNRLPLGMYKVGGDYWNPSEYDIPTYHPDFDGEPGEEVAALIEANLNLDGASNDQIHLATKAFEEFFPYPEWGKHLGRELDPGENYTKDDLVRVIKNSVTSNRPLQTGTAHKVHVEDLENLPEFIPLLEYRIKFPETEYVRPHYEVYRHGRKDDMDMEDMINEGVPLDERGPARLSDMFNYANYAIKRDHQVDFAGNTEFSSPSYRSRGDLGADDEYGEVTIELDRPDVKVMGSEERNKFVHGAATGPVATDQRRVATDFYSPIPQRDLDILPHAKYTKGHWDEPDVVSHYRYSTGRPLLSTSHLSEPPKHFHQEEFQSDWGERARDWGVKGTPVDPKDITLDKPPRVGAGVSMEGSQFRVSHPNIGQFIGKRAQRDHLERVKAALEGRPGFGRDYWFNTMLKNHPKGFVRMDADLTKEYPDLSTAEQAANMLMRMQYNEGAVPGPYLGSNAWEQLTLRTALKDAIDQDAKVFTWPMGREHWRRYPDDENPQILTGNIASSDIRAVNYFNKLLKPYGEKVTHDRQINTGPDVSSRISQRNLMHGLDPLGYRADPEGSIIENVPLRALSKISLEPDLFGTALRGLDDEFLAVQPTSDLASQYKRILQQELLDRTDRVHRLNITPEMKAMFKKGIPLTVPPLTTLSLFGDEE